MKSGPFGDFDRGSLHGPIDDTFRHASEKQINFIEILRNDLGLSLQSRNAHIASVLGKPFNGDVWALSMGQAGRVISVFKEWKQNKLEGESWGPQGTDEDEDED